MVFAVWKKSSSWILSSPENHRAMTLFPQKTGFKVPARSQNARKPSLQISATKAIEGQKNSTPAQGPQQLRPLLLWQEGLHYYGIHSFTDTQKSGVPSLGPAYDYLGICLKAVLKFLTSEEINSSCQNSKYIFFYGSSQRFIHKHLRDTYTNIFNKVWLFSS